MKGALPPSSSDSRFSVGAPCAASTRPTSVEPVKLSLRTAGCEVSSPPMARAPPVITLRTPAGTPARVASSASANADNGVCAAGLTTIVQPAASAGATLRVIIAAGKFHGVMAAHPPPGSWTTTMRLSAQGDGMVSPYTRRASSANHSM
jgi:hypothetical protein